MSLPTTVAEVIDRHVKFTLKSIDRMYLNGYQSMLRRGGGVSMFFRQHRQETCATALVMLRFDALTRPTQVEGQRVSGLKFGDPTVVALFNALLMFRLLVRGFSHKDLRSHVAQFLVLNWLSMRR